MNKWWREVKFSQRSITISYLLDNLFRPLPPITYLYSLIRSDRTGFRNPPIRSRKLKKKHRADENPRLRGLK